MHLCSCHCATKHEDEKIKNGAVILSDERSLAIVCYEKFERIETSQFLVLLNMIFIIEKA